MKSKLVVLMIAGFLLLFACDNPIIERLYLIDTLEIAIPEDIPPESDSGDTDSGGGDPAVREDTKTDPPQEPPLDPPPAITYTVTFESNGGTPEPAPQTGLSDGAFVTAVADPSKPFSADGLEAGLYKNWPGYTYTFEGWYDGDTKWDFATGTVTGNITLTAQWGGSSGNMVPYATVAKNDVAAAVTYAGNNATATDKFYLLMDGNAILSTTETVTLNKPNFNLTIIGIGGERTISLSTRSGPDFRILFTLAHADASLTLGNNITLMGRGTSINVYDSPLVRVTAGTLIMENGSKITGHSGERLHGAVDINGDDARFYMKGGQITGNRTSKADTGARPTDPNERRAWATTAGVFLYNGLFDMSGGSITGNIYDASSYTQYKRIDYDLRIVIDVGGPHSLANPSKPQFILSGSAEIGSIIFTLGNTTDSASGTTPDTTPHIQLDYNFTGSVSDLNFALIGSNQESAIRPKWTSLPIRYFITGPGATEANIGKFDRINWWAGTNTAAITTHILACDPGNGIYLKTK